MFQFLFQNGARSRQIKKEQEEAKKIAELIRSIIVGQTEESAKPKHPLRNKSRSNKMTYIRKRKKNKRKHAKQYALAISEQGNEIKTKNATLTAAQQAQLSQAMHSPSLLSQSLDLLRLMPNPFKTQSVFTEMFQHDWRSMSVPDLLGALNDPAVLQNNIQHDSNDMTASVYWWGYEIYIPQKTLQRLEDEGDVATGVLYFLSALSRTVPAIYPFVNMIATFVAMQFTIIKAADMGNGIVLVATW